MNKEAYERTQLEIVLFHAEDIITQSIPMEDDETSRLDETSNPAEQQKPQ